MSATQVRRANMGRGILHLVFALSYADTALIVAGASANVNLGDVLPAGAEVISAWTKLDTAFTAGGGVTGLTVEVGTSADTDAFITAGEVLSGSPTLTRRHVEGAWITADAKQLLARFTASGANLGNGTVTNLTAGKLKVHVLIAIAKDVT